MRAISMWLDMVILIIIMAVGAVMSVTLFTIFRESPVQRTEDKTMMDVNNAIYTSEGPDTGADILMGLLLVDDYAPYPRAIKINDKPIIKLDNYFVTNKYILINNIYNGAEQDLKSMVNWKVKEVRFAYEETPPCIKYTLAP